jgi:hypothetical protein
MIYTALEVSAVSVEILWRSGLKVTLVVGSPAIQIRGPKSGSLGMESTFLNMGILASWLMVELIGWGYYLIFSRAHTIGAVLSGYTLRELLVFKESASSLFDFLRLLIGVLTSGNSSSLPERHEVVHSRRLLNLLVGKCCDVSYLSHLKRDVSLGQEGGLNGLLDWRKH